MWEWISLVLAVLVADVLSRVVGHTFKQVINRGKPECGLCHKVRITRKTKDKKYWACRRCRYAYSKENSL